MDSPGLPLRHHFLDRPQLGVDVSVERVALPPSLPHHAPRLLQVLAATEGAPMGGREGRGGGR